MFENAAGAADFTLVQRLAELRRREYACSVVSPPLRSCCWLWFGASLPFSFRSRGLDCGGGTTRSGVATRLASWLRRGELLVSDGGVWLQWLVLRASMVGVASFNGVVGALLPHVEVKGGDGTGPGSDTCERAEWTVNRSSMAVFTLLSKLQAFLESTSCHRFESFDSVSVCESLSLFLRFSKTARERLSFGLGRGGVALGPSYHPSAGEGSLIHHWFGGGSSELFAWLGGGFKRCVTLRTTRALVW
ncbi:hypothetical protein Bca4012_075496 [Brassica carinata]